MINIFSPSNNNENNGEFHADRYTRYCYSHLLIDVDTSVLFSFGVLDLSTARFTVLSVDERVTLGVPFTQSRLLTRFASHSLDWSNGCFQFV